MSPSLAVFAPYEERLFCLLGVSISKRENCTLSKMGDRADVLIWLHMRIEEKALKFRSAFPCEIFSRERCITNARLALQANSFA